MITGATLICLHVQNNCSAKGLLTEICPTAIIVLMPVNQVDIAFECAVIFVCWIIFMLLNIVIDHLHHISTYTYFI